MKILLFNYEFPPAGGGASAATYYMGKELARRGHDVDVLTGQTDGQPEIEHVDGMSVYRVSTARKSIHDAGLLAAISYVYFARGVLKRLLRENDYDFGHFYFAVPTGLLAFRWRAMTDAPYLVSLRGSDVPFYDPNATTINFLHRLLKPLTRSILRQSHSIVANSDSLRKLALKSFDNEKILTITNGVCPDDFKPGDDTRQAEQRVTALCVARLVPRKGIEVVLEALALCKSSNLRVVVAGTGPDRNVLIAHVKRLRIDDRIDFVGSLGPDELLAQYQRADFLIHPALTESFSMTLLEAMSCGLPIIASNAGGIPELVEHNVNGMLIPPGDGVALANAIDSMASSKSIREEFSAANRTKILEQFTSEHIARQYEQLYGSDATPASKS